MDSKITISFSAIINHCGISNGHKTIEKAWKISGADRVAELHWKDGVFLKEIIHKRINNKQKINKILAIKEEK